MIYPKVKDVLCKYIEGGISLLESYLNQEDIHIDEVSWVNEIKKNLNNKEYLTAQAKIELVKYKIELFKNKHYDEKKSNQED